MKSFHFQDGHSKLFGMRTIMLGLQDSSDISKKEKNVLSLFLRGGETYRKYFFLDLQKKYFKE